MEREYTTILQAINVKDETTPNLGILVQSKFLLFLIFVILAARDRVGQIPGMSTTLLDRDDLFFGPEYCGGGLVTSSCGWFL